MIRRRAVPVGARPAALVLVAVLLGLLGGAVPGRAASTLPAQAAGSLVLALDTMTPRIVRPDGPPELFLSGRLRNTGPLAVRDVTVRVQRGPALTAERDVARALTGADPAAEVRPAPVEVAAGLGPGEERPFALRVPLRGSADSLALAAPGVYPFVVGAAADREDGQGAETARADAVRLLLPVLGLPPVPTGARPPPLVVPAVGRAERVSVLYPVADRPRRLPVAPGAPTLLTDDTLADALASRGRLAGLVDALGRAAPLGSAAASSVCVAVDADLLETATAMGGGYQVATPAGPVAGRGADAARAWLVRLGTAVAGRCVLALPYADADLVATSRGSLTDLTTTARTSGAARVAALLDVTPVPDATWPAGGVLDERTLSDLATGGARTLVVDGSALRTEDGETATARLAASPDAPVLAVGTDPVTTTALSGTPAAVGAPGRSPAGTAAALSVQDGLAALVLRTTTRASGPGRTTAPGTTVLAPPREWAAGADDGAEAAQLLTTVGELARLGLAAPTDLGTLASAGPGAAAPAVLASGPARGSAADTEALARARTIRDDQRDLLAASEQDRAGAPTPAEFVAPLTGDLLRSLTAATRGDPATRTAAVSAVGVRMDALRASVRVVQPSGPYSLGTSDAPLLLTVDNRLPVAVSVAVRLEPTPGLRTSPIPVQLVPAFGSRQFQVGIQVIRSGQFSVDAQALTPGGELLGPTSRLLLRSTAYGTITVWLTASAAIVLVILASVRIARRVRAARAERTDRFPSSPAGPTTPSGPSAPPTDPPRQLQDR